MNAQRAADFFSRPGIDPRIWAITGIVEAVVTNAQGRWLDVRAKPEGWRCRVKQVGFAMGSGAALYLPAPKDAEVLCVFPSGDPNAGGYAIAGLHNQAHALPVSGDDAWFMAPSGMAIHLDAGRVEVAGGALELALFYPLMTVIHLAYVALINHSHPVDGGTALPSPSLALDLADCIGRLMGERGKSARAYSAPA
jgi:hypothetical protein